jgi:hypothetical protein
MGKQSEYSGRKFKIQEWKVGWDLFLANERDKARPCGYLPRRSSNPRCGDNMEIKKLSFTDRDYWVEDFKRGEAKFKLERFLE